MAVRNLISLIYIQIQTTLACQAHKWMPCPISPDAQENSQDTIQRHPRGCQVLFLLLQFPRFWQCSFPTISQSSSLFPKAFPKAFGGKMRRIICLLSKLILALIWQKLSLCPLSSVFELDLGGCIATSQKRHLSCWFPCFSVLFSPQVTSTWNSFSSSELVSKWIHSEH